MLISSWKRLTGLELDWPEIVEKPRWKGNGACAELEGGLVSRMS